MEAGSKQEVEAIDAWYSLMKIIDFFAQVLSLTTQIALFVNVSQLTGGPFFAIVCVVKPIFIVVFRPNLFDSGTFSTTLPAFFDPEGSLYHMFAVCFAYVDNEDAKQMSALKTFTGTGYQQDLISNNLGEWIING